MELLHVEKMEKRAVALHISTKYEMDTTTAYRNISEINNIIKNNIKVLTLLRSTPSEGQEFRAEFEKIRISLS